MNKIHLVFSCEPDAYKINKSIREFFKESKLYEKNIINISPVKREQQISKGVGIYRWAFDISFIDDHDTDNEESISQATFSGGEITIMKIKNIWAFEKLDNYVIREDK